MARAWLCHSNAPDVVRKSVDCGGNHHLVFEVEFLFGELVDDGEFLRHGQQKVQCLNRVRTTQSSCLLEALFGFETTFLEAT